MEPETDPEAFRKLVKKVGQEFLAHPEHGPKFIEPLKSQGVYFVDDDSALVMRVKFKCRPARSSSCGARSITGCARPSQRTASGSRRKVEVIGPGAAVGAADDAFRPPAAAAE
jgi:moderate conductance mechanosensitive channel